MGRGRRPSENAAAMWFQWAKAGYTFFTIDPSEEVDKPPPPEAVKMYDSLYLGTTRELDEFAVTFDRERSVRMPFENTGARSTRRSRRRVGSPRRRLNMRSKSPSTKRMSRRRRLSICSSGWN